MQMRPLLSFLSPEWGWGRTQEKKLAKQVSQAKLAGALGSVLAEFRSLLTISRDLVHLTASFQGQGRTFQQTAL